VLQDGSASFKALGKGQSLQPSWVCHDGDVTPRDCCTLNRLVAWP